jgi:hypothetical protein
MSSSTINVGSTWAVIVIEVDTRYNASCSRWVPIKRGDTIIEGMRESRIFDETMQYDDREYCSHHSSRDGSGTRKVTRAWPPRIYRYTESDGTSVDRSVPICWGCCGEAKEAREAREECHARVSLAMARAERDIRNGVDE